MIREHASVLRYTYIDCIVVNTFLKSTTATSTDKTKHAYSIFEEFLNILYSYPGVTVNTTATASL
jgi:hypothetical protein